MRHRPGRRDVLDLQRDGIGLEDAHPDRQDPIAVLVPEDDDRHVRDRIDHQALDDHLALHRLPRLPSASPANPRRHRRHYKVGAARPPVKDSTRPQRLCGPARSIRTATSDPSCDASPGKFTTVFPTSGPRVRSRAGGSRRPPGPRPSSRSPPRCSVSWMLFLAAPGATARRRAFSSSGTSSASRLAASVPGRSEYLKENIEWKPTASTRLSVSAKSSSVSPGKPDDHVGRQLDARHRDPAAPAPGRGSPPACGVFAWPPGPASSPTGPAGAGACRRAAGPASRRSGGP